MTLHARQPPLTLSPTEYRALLREDFYSFLVSCIGKLNSRKDFRRCHFNMPAWRPGRLNLAGARVDENATCVFGMDAIDWV